MSYGDDDKQVRQRHALAALTVLRQVLGGEVSLPETDVEEALRTLANEPKPSVRADRTPIRTVWEKAAALEADRLAATLTYLGVKVERPDPWVVVVHAPCDGMPLTLALSATSDDILTRCGPEINVSIPHSRRGAVQLALSWVEP